MQRFAEEELGVEFKFDSMINPRIDCSQSPLEVRLSPEECVALDLEDPKRSDEWCSSPTTCVSALEKLPPARATCTSAAAASARSPSIRTAA